MRALGSLALNTFRETIRDRILYALLVFAVLMMASSLLFGTLTVGQDRKIVLDLGLGAIEVFGVAIAVFVGTSMIHKEVDKRTVYTVLTKPVPRHVFILGKFFGLSLTLWLLLGLMGGAYLGLAAWIGAYQPALWAPLGLIGLELGLLVAVTLFFSTFSSPLMSMIFTICLYVIGHNTEALRELARKAAPGVRLLAEGLYYALPNLSAFDAKNFAVYGQAVPAWHWLWALGYGLAYTLALLVTASVLFERREF